MKYKKYKIQDLNLEARSKFKIQAYTLIEILVALTIVGLLFGVGYVSFRDFSRRSAISGAAKKIQGDLRLAQGMALAGQKPSDCIANLDGYRFKVINSTEYKIEAICGNVTSVTKDVEISSDLSLTISPAPPILFKVLGSGTDIGDGNVSTLTLTQAGTSNKIDIVITSGGEIK